MGSSQSRAAPTKVYAWQKLAEADPACELPTAIHMLRPHLRGNRDALLAFNAERKNPNSRVSRLAADIIVHCIVPYVAGVSARTWGDDIFTRNSAALAEYEHSRYIAGHTVHSRALPHLSKELAAARVDAAQPKVLVKGLPEGVVERVWIGRYPYYYPNLHPDRVAVVHAHLQDMFCGKKVMPICTLPCGLVLYCVTVRRSVERVWLLLDPETLAGVEVLAPDPGRSIIFGQYLIDDFGHLTCCDCSKLYGFSKYTMMYAQYTVPV